MVCNSITIFAVYWKTKSYVWLIKMTREFTSLDSAENNYSSASKLYYWSGEDTMVDRREKNEIFKFLVFWEKLPKAVD